jgi:hypothetical protein
MKKIFFIKSHLACRQARFFRLAFYFSFFTLHFSLASAQTGYTGMDVLAGISTNNSKFASLIFEKEGAKKISFAYSIETIRYSTITSTYNFSGNDTYLSAGLMLSSKLAYSRNFSTRIFLGAMAATDNSSFVWYPVIGLRENINLSPKFSLLFQQRGAYIFNLSQNNWQASLHIGCRFML